MKKHNHDRTRASRRMVATLRVLQRELPALRTVKLRRRRLPDVEDAWATCELVTEEEEEDEPAYFLISLDSRLPEPAASWALLHELAHVLSWQTGGPRDETDHSPEWGLAMARLYALWELLP
ncbi:MAG TPA: hypothetical protein VK824_10870 [Planctomycetota bacterium]|nr:hypothetical protein [Planctomycetota bacterium]